VSTVGTPSPGECWRLKMKDRALAQHWRVTAVVPGPGGHTIMLRRDSDGKESSAAEKAFAVAFEPCSEHSAGGAS
jgi:hypothetical protein